LLKNILPYCGYSPTSPFFFLFSENEHGDNAATNSKTRTLEAEGWQVCGEACLERQKKMSQLMGAFGLLGFIMLRPVLFWRAF
jgi:hypothetical protein